MTTWNFIFAFETTLLKTDLQYIYISLVQFGLKIWAYMIIRSNWKYLKCWKDRRINFQGLFKCGEQTQDNLKASQSKTSTTFLDHLDHSPLWRCRGSPFVSHGGYKTWSFISFTGIRFTKLHFVLITPLTQFKWFSL